MQIFPSSVPDPQHAAWPDLSFFLRRYRFFPSPSLVKDCETNLKALGESITVSKFPDMGLV